MQIYIRIQEVLDERGMKQKELAELTGLRPTTISELCNNVRSTVNREHLARVAEALGIEDIRQLVELRK